MNELEKRVFIRKYESISKFGDDVTFEEWMNTIEHSISMGHGEYPAIIKINQKNHSKLFKKMESLFTEFKEVIEVFHEESFKNLLEEIRLKNNYMQLFNVKNGRIPIPGAIAIHLLNGMEISKKESGGYELFRIYYHHALNNHFNMPERAEYFANGYWPEGTCFVREAYTLEKGYHNYFPDVPASPQPNNDWARSLKQTLKKIIERENQ